MIFTPDADQEQNQLEELGLLLHQEFVTLTFAFISFAIV